MIHFISNPTRFCLALQVWQILLTSSPAIKLEMRNSKTLFIFSLGKLNPKEEKFLCNSTNSIPNRPGNLAIDWNN